jgi:hypothetical protein
MNNFIKKYLSMKNLLLDKDAFSSGQISSKIWLCEHLEGLRWKSNETDIYGGWYGILAFLLLSRGKFTVNKIRSFDKDPLCQPIADSINENWVWQDWKFKSFTEDCNTLESTADLIINTSTEHFESKQWFDNIDQGTRIILQGNNMKHDDHIIHVDNLNDFVNLYSLSSIKYQGQLDFTYPTWSFSRYMIIGIK